MPPAVPVSPADAQYSTFPFLSTPAFPPKKEYVGVVGWKASVAVLAVSSSCRSGTVLKHAGCPVAPHVPPEITNTAARSSPLSKSTSENFPVVFVVVKEGPCCAKNQSVG